MSGIFGQLSSAAFGRNVTAFSSGSLGATMVEAGRARYLNRSGFSTDIKLPLKPVTRFNDGHLPALRGLGAITMSAETQAALKTCSDSCEKTYGVTSGRPDFVALAACFAACNTKYPPTVDPSKLPAVPGITPVPVAPAPAPSPTSPTAPNPYEPLVPPAPAKSKTGTYLLVGGGLLALAGVGVYAYKKSKKKAAYTSNRRRRRRR